MIKRVGSCSDCDESRKNGLDQWRDYLESIRGKKPKLVDLDKKNQQVDAQKKRVINHPFSKSLDLKG